MNWIKVEKILDILLFVAYIVVIVGDLVAGRVDNALAWLCCMAWHVKSNVETMRRRVERREKEMEEL